MKNKFILIAVIAYMLLPCQVFAATSTMQVSANIVPTLLTTITRYASFGNVSSSTQYPTTTAEFLVSVENGVPYRVSLDAGLHKAASGLCRSMTGGAASRSYAFFTDAAHTIAWGDSDTNNTCSGNTNNGGASVSKLGVYAGAATTIYVKAWPGTGLAAITDTVTITFTY